MLSLYSPPPLKNVDVNLLMYQSMFQMLMLWQISQATRCEYNLSKYIVSIRVYLLDCLHVYSKSHKMKG